MKVLENRVGGEVAKFEKNISFEKEAGKKKIKQKKDGIDWVFKIITFYLTDIFYF